MPRRKLKSDEVELWEQVAKSATPLKLPQNIKTVAKPKPKKSIKQTEKFELNNFEVGEKVAQKSAKNEKKGPWQGNFLKFCDFGTPSEISKVQRLKNGTLPSGMGGGTQGK